MEYINSNEIKNELIKMFIILIDFFETNNIDYSIMSGTMLGAIRHKGFIPWDDDIDVAVLRKDYNKLIGVLKKNKQINDIYCFEGFELSTGSRPFLKIVNKKIRVETEYKEDKYLWIDVFPIDGIPNKFSKLYIFYIKKVLRNAINLSDRKLFSEIIDEHNVFYNSYYLFLKMLFSKKTMDEILNIYIKESSKYDVDMCTFVQDVTWGTKKFPRYLFDDLVDYQFENITVKGFKDYDTYLTCIYGDYMKLPPEDQRVNHGIKAWRVNSDEE